MIQLAEAGKCKYSTPSPLSPNNLSWYWRAGWTDPSHLSPHLIFQSLIPLSHEARQKLKEV